MRNTTLRVVLGTALTALLGLGLAAAPPAGAAPAAPAKAVKCKTLKPVKVSIDDVRLGQQNLNGTGTPNSLNHSFIGYWRYNGREYRKTFIPTRATYIVEHMNFYKVDSWDKGQKCGSWINPAAPVGGGFARSAHRGTAKSFDLAALQRPAARAACRVLNPSMRSDRTFDLLMTHNLGSGYKGKPFAFVVTVSRETDTRQWKTVSVKTYSPNRHAVRITTKVPRGQFISQVRGGCAGSTATPWNAK